MDRAGPARACVRTVAAVLLVAAVAGCSHAIAGSGGGVPQASVTPATLAVTGSTATVTGATATVTGSPATVTGATATVTAASKPGRATTMPAIPTPPSTTRHTTPPSTTWHPSPLATSGQSTTATAGTPFRASIGRIDDALARRMHTSYHAGCPVPLSGLRYLRMTYWGFDGRAHTGEMIVSARVARDVVTAFESLYAHRFPIRQMRLVDDFGGSDDASMAADNTSAFNCRPITGGGGWSEHSYGEAIDINPVQNPYLSGSTVLPPAGRAYLDRPDEPGVIHSGGVAVRVFSAIGWTWGGTWTSPVDLQHFSRSGR